MASYRILFKRSAVKELRGIPNPFLRSVLKKIEALSAHPRPANCEKMSGEDGHFRIRHADYRIVYEVDDISNDVIIIKIGHRRDIYR